ncbi:hypothetical protein E4T43_00188 [Aureobasidium subglaciale]|nr:hypothetical protein E4T43_00188 [Aureobasidium subglaciale]
MALLNAPVLAVLATVALFALQLITLRLLSLAPHRRPPPTPRQRHTPAHLLIVLGSGGHTAEMISMLRRSNTCSKFSHRTWLVSSGDSFSAAFANECEQEMGEKNGTYRVVEYGYPDLIITNGPATATILVFASVLLRFLGLQGSDVTGEMRTIYVESWARVKKLSLSGRLLCWVVDRVLVQWEQLQGAGAGGRAEFKGVLV